MEFSKDNIVSKHFSKKLWGGLDEFEVRDFLHVLAEEMRHLTRKVYLQKQQIQELESLIKDYRDREHILKESIVSAESWAEKIRKDAETNSHLVLAKAQDKSTALIQEARHSLQTVYNDIADLKRLQLQFKTGLKAALQVQMDLLDQDPLFSPGPALPLSEKETFLEKNSVSEKDNSSVEKEPSSSAPKTVEKELSSLKKSISSLNKDFS